MDFSPSPSDHKKQTTERCSSLVQTKSGAAMVNVTVATKELTYQLQTCTIVIRKLAHKNDSSANRKKNATALWIITDSPLYVVIMLQYIEGCALHLQCRYYCGICFKGCKYKGRKSVKN
jgi:hypothetical protein